jgi:hypothetical protein
MFRGDELFLFFIDVSRVGLVSQSLVGGVPQLTVPSPSAEFDLCDEIGTKPNDILSLLPRVDRRRSDRYSVHLLAKRSCGGRGKACPDAADIYEVVVLSSRQKQPADATKCIGRALIADDDEPFRLHALDFEPFAVPPAAIGLGAVLGDYAL